MSKILTIAWKELYSAFTDRPRLLIMFASPLAISIILGMAFGGGGGSISISDIDLAIVNLDEGTADTNYGATVTAILMSENPEGTDDAACILSSDASPQQQQSLDDFLNATLLESAEAARNGVDEGLYAAAVIIPHGYSAALAPNLMNFSGPDEIESVHIEIYGSGGSPISAGVVRSIVEAVNNSIVTGSTTIRASLATYVRNPLNLPAIASADESAFADFACGFDPSLGTITLQPQAMNDVQARSIFDQIMISIGAAQALFFSLTTANASIQSIYEDRKAGVLQRLLVSPTPRVYILAGKVVGTLLIVLAQVGILLLALTVAASMVGGSPVWLWGNPLYVFLFLLLIGIAVSGVAIFVTGLARTPEEAQIIGTLVSLGMAILGGTFGFQVGEVGKLSLIWWGVDGLNTLSSGSTEIGLSAFILGLQGVLLFVLGSWLFNRRVTV